MRHILWQEVRRPLSQKIRYGKDPMIELFTYLANKRIVRRNDSYLLISSSSSYSSSLSLMAERGREMEEERERWRYWQRDFWRVNQIKNRQRREATDRKSEIHGEREVDRQRQVARHRGREREEGVKRENNC